ncbi:MAG TPA: YraN family protein [Kofleriaceae bacterium]|jgi:putative endonuclease
MASTTDKGRGAEGRAVAHLASLGYQILERNTRTAGGELDIVAREGGDLVFIEVRSRADDSAGRAEDTVGPAKRSRVARAAAAYLLERNPPRDCCRFDVVAITGDTIEVYRDAFRLGLLARYG